MEVQADLVRLDQSGHLPLPWSVRAHLGLETGVGVTIVLTRPPAGQGRIPDILVTPLTPHRLNCTLSVELVVPEKEGAVRDVLAHVSDEANIVISDTITLEGRDKHKLNLVIEPAFGSPTVEAFEEKVAKMFSALAEKPVISPVYPSHQELELEEPLRIDKGYIKWNGWLPIFSHDYAKDVGLYDLTRVVVSSNPDQRVVRYIFPRRGVVQITAPHNNLPGAVHAIAGAISKKGYNILSSRLSRTPRPGATERMSVFVAVCEPGKKASVPDDLKAAVRAINNVYIAKGCSIDFGQKAANSRYLIPRGARMVRPPADLKPLVAEERQTAKIATPNPDAKLVFFLSYRFVRGLTNDQNYLVEHAESLKVMRQAIRDVGCAHIEAPQQHDFETSREAIYPKLWAADACLVLALDESGSGKLSLSQAHETGFFIGQRKPVKILVERERSRDVAALGNMDGYLRLDYDSKGPPSKSADHRSLYQRVYRYAYSLAEERGHAPPNLELKESKKS